MNCRWLLSWDDRYFRSPHSCTITKSCHFYSWVREKITIENWVFNVYSVQTWLHTYLDHVMPCDIYDHWCVPLLGMHQWSAWVKVTPRNDSGRYSEMSSETFPSSVPRKRTRIRPRNSLLGLECFSVLSEVWPRNKQEHIQLFTFIVLRSSRRYIKYQARPISFPVSSHFPVLHLLA